MTREQLAHVLRAVSQLTGDPRGFAKSGQRAMIVESFLGGSAETLHDHEAAPQATGSMEVDSAFRSDP